MDKSFRREGFIFGLQFKRYSGSWWGKRGVGGGLRQLITLHTGSREQTGSGAKV